MLATVVSPPSGPPQLITRRKIGRPHRDHPSPTAKDHSSEATEPQLYSTGRTGIPLLEHFTRRGQYLDTYA